MKEVQAFAVGSLVESLCGSDCNKVYIVVGYDDKGYALLVDGDRHKLASPKRKNNRHIKFAGAVARLPKTDAAVVTAIRRNKI